MHLVLARQVLRGDICQVHVTLDFPHLDRSSANFLLEIPGVSLQVPQFAQPRPGRDAKGCTGVGPHPDRCVVAQVLHDGLFTQARAIGLHQAIELGLAR